MSYLENWLYHHHILHESFKFRMMDNQNDVTKQMNTAMVVNCPYGNACPLVNQCHLSMQPVCQNWAFLNTQVCGECFALDGNFSMYMQMAYFANQPIQIIRNPPCYRTWENVSEYGKKLNGTKMQIKVMSYNVLSQMILEANLNNYNACKIENLAWETRRERIFHEVLDLSPDIFCFQEVQASQLSFYWRFFQIGYDGYFKKKTRSKDDGCAVFFKCSMFQMIDQLSIEFRYEELPLLCADSIGIIVKLLPRYMPYSPFVVATTHLVYARMVAPTRLAQMRILMDRIEKFSYDRITKKQLPVILSGDFNAMPKSKVIKFLDNGRVCIPLEESLQSIGLVETPLEFNAEDEKQYPDADQFRLAHHPFKLSSVYEIKTGRGNKGQWCTVDHIYFTNKNIKVLERLEPPPEPFIRTIPNENFGSDHISIAAVLEMLIGNSVK